MIQQKTSSQTFLDIQNSKHWDQQVSYLQQIQITQGTARLLNCPKNASVLKQLLSNSRTKVITTTTIFLIQFFQRYGPLLHSFALNILGCDVIFKLLNSSNKVIFSSAHQLLKSIIINSPHSKFYPILITEFNSKNAQVRECISSYFLVLAGTIEFPNNFISFVRNLKGDSSKAVRDNFKKLQQLTTQQTNKNNKNIKGSKISIRSPKRQKQNIPALKQLKPKQKQQSKSQQNSQMIIQSFIKIDELPPSYTQLETVQFLLSKLKADEGWNMKHYAIEQLCGICQTTLLEQKVFNRIIPQLVELLDQKRGKVHLKVSQALRDVIQLNYQQFKLYIQNNFTFFIEKAVKNQQHGILLISKVVDMEPLKNIVQLTQLSVQCKSIKQKIIILDLLVEKVCSHDIQFSKVVTMTKLICKHIQKNYTNKQIYLPCLAILSHFKSAYPNDFVGCLLSQQKQVLNRIIAIAQQIDPLLRQAILTYIHSLKVGEKKEKKSQEIDKLAQNNELQQLLNVIMGQQQQSSVSRLAQYIFQHKQNISIQQYYYVIKLTQRVTSQNSLLELELLLQQICKTQSEKYLQALFQAINSCNSNTIQSEYIVTYLRKIYLIFSTFSWLMSPKHTLKLINNYRYSKCPKVRLMCIKILGIFPNQFVDSIVNSKEKQLIAAHHKIQPLSQFMK